ncbi:hypothetical protein C8R44DRAFT_808123 [Mycena epipterygia]|nr:hypothetical protein C8R44DRAFT_808123 [Mycena epipterygia]
MEFRSLAFVILVSCSFLVAPVFANLCPGMVKFEFRVKVSRDGVALNSCWTIRLVFATTTLEAFSLFNLKSGSHPKKVEQQTVGTRNVHGVLCSTALPMGEYFLQHWPVLPASNPRFILSSIHILCSAFKFGLRKTKIKQAVRPIPD